MHNDCRIAVSMENMFAEFGYLIKLVSIRNNVNYIPVIICLIAYLKFYFSL